MRVGRKDLKLSGASRRLLLADRREALLLEDLEEDLEFAEDWACSGPMMRKERGENEGE
ncbi:hypothetical protein [Paenibacillus herberti]|uniref:hypothetical protein n=1 Tax=Paenibacillus herberti TaxID=1619309 RepID=UPI001595651A|nr:hypothetical protein [Paenibacillus herberti]